ncbi:GNAT family N-acetyltransferase [Peribacillus alkalitolerans]|uniref:GNAT family N-acetyltransferase n=1 Tax=Peribacillus alkalitolerans TaxID=1550385 RepID=UPI0013D15B1D|nr:GNAT family N-acetyltransferase [Peribacillus alkalitolerans]
MKFSTERLEIIACTNDNTTNLRSQYELGPHIEMHLKEVQLDPTTLGWGVWLVLLRDSKEVIGDIGFKGKPNHLGKVEIGYGITPSAQQKGYATEAVNGLIHHAFSTGKVDKVVAECLHNNVASIKVLEKVGMLRTGTDDEMLYWELIKQ